MQYHTHIEFEFITVVSVFKNITIVSHLKVDEFDYQFNYSIEFYEEKKIFMWRHFQVVSHLYACSKLFHQLFSDSSWSIVLLVEIILVAPE